MKILVTGGCGYKGTVLTQKLLEQGNDVTVVDTQWFGNHLEDHARLEIIKGDVRETDKIPLDGVDTVIHLANIANDPGVELNPSLSWEVNVLATQQLADKSVRSGVQQFIFASSGSVYGIKEEAQVTEDLPLVPISVYNKTKMVAERVLLSFQKDIQIHCIRPATVCGWSPRMRLDVSVNMLTLQALKNGVITVFGGEQTRPNIHIQDMIGVYQHFLENPNLDSGCYNAGFENISILDIAQQVVKKIPAEIQVTDSNDPRSYRQNSDKLMATGFLPQYSVADAIDDVINRYKDGHLVDSDQCYTVRWMKQLNLDSQM
ncbi:MAG TPA: SDR family NAD-dependent epimerase/dehydratase [Gammaproteobacteria bacterium]|jgi:nucleoside-diphosphate-sugar epimerase|nr:SDR family oxidoreductase [Bacteroidetes Order II. bacterium]HIG44712.1 SDR family NAD-dependent epimerase/dehydratase [Gammaproteobacteria bacterium]